MATEFYVMKAIIFKRSLTKYGKLECCRCGLPIKKGQRVVSKQCCSKYITKKRLYHGECWDAMFL